MSTLIRNMRYSLAEQVVMAAGILVSIAFIRYLGPERYGVYAYYTSVASIAGVLTFGHFENLYIREVAQQRDPEALTSAFLLLNFLGALLQVLAMLAYYFVYAQSDRLSPLLMALTAVTAFVGSKNILRAYLVARQSIGLAVLLGLGISLLAMALRVIGILTQQPLVYFFALLVVDTVVGVAVFGTAYGWRRAVRFDAPGRRIAQLFATGWPLLVTGASILVFMKVDQVMLFHMTSAREVGAYGSMMYLNERLFVFIGVVMTAFYPYLSEKHRSDPEQYLRAVRIGHKLFSIVAIPMAVFMIANHEAVVAAIFGTDFASESRALAYLAGALLFIYWGAINQKVLIITHALKLDLFFAGSSALVSIALNLLLIPRYGIVGAAIASLFSHGFYFWAQFFIPRYRPYNYYILLSIPAPLAMALVSLALSHATGAGVVFQFLLYAGAYALLLAALVRAPLSEEYGTLGRLFFTKMLRFGREAA